MISALIWQVFDGICVPVLELEASCVIYKIIVEGGSIGFPESTGPKFGQIVNATCGTVAADSGLPEAVTQPDDLGRATPLLIRNSRLTFDHPRNQGLDQLSSGTA